MKPSGFSLDMGGPIGRPFALAPDFTNVPAIQQPPDGSNDIAVAQFGSAADRHACMYGGGEDLVPLDPRDPVQRLSS
jgi:hypothetical protein